MSSDIFNKAYVWNWDKWRIDRHIRTGNKALDDLRPPKFNTDDEYFEELERLAGEAIEVARLRDVRTRSSDDR